MRSGVGPAESQWMGQAGPPDGNGSDPGSEMEQPGSQGGGREGTAEGWPGQGRDDVTQAVRVASHRALPIGEPPEAQGTLRR